MRKRPRQTIEVIGRLHLWEVALQDAVRCLQLADRLEAAIQSAAIQADARAVLERFRERTGRALDPRTSFATDSADLEACRSDLPMPNEFGEAGRHLRLLAVIYFWQLHSPGDAGLNLAAGNLRNPAADILKAIEAEAFPGAAEYAVFEQLKETTRILRHNQIAHASANHFGLDHQPHGVVSTAPMLPPVEAWALLNACSKLLAAVRRELSNLMSAASAD